MSFFFFFKQKTAYEMRISDWSSDVCSSDLPPPSEPEIPRACRYPTPHGISAVAARDRRQTPRPDQPRRHPPLSHRVPLRDRKSVVSGQSVSVRVDLGGRRIIKKKRYTSKYTQHTTQHTPQMKQQNKT